MLHEESAEARKQRLAKALKANIARRKAQARQRPAAGRDKPE
jgi:ribosomal protein L39E